MLKDVRRRYIFTERFGNLPEMQHVMRKLFRVRFELYKMCEQVLV